MDYHNYMTLRAMGYGALQAWQMGKRRSSASIDFDSEERAQVERGRYSFQLRLEVDDTGDASYLGEFYKDWAPGRIHMAYSCRGCCYYEPCNKPESGREWYLKHKYSKRDAYELPQKQMRDDIRRLRALWRGDWYFKGMTCRAFYGGVQVATSSVWGLESYAGKDYFNEIAEDLITEATGEADETMEKLCPGQTVKILIQAGVAEPVTVPAGISVIIEYEGDGVDEPAATMYKGPIYEA